MRTILTTVLTSVIAFPWALVAAEPPKPLFNGRDFTGWNAITTGAEIDTEAGHKKTSIANGRFRVIEEIIVVDGRNRTDVILNTQDSFEGNVAVRFDYLPGPGCSNEIHFRGIKFKIKSTGIVNIKLGEWNRMELIVSGKEIEIRNNGEVIKKLTSKTAVSKLGLRAEAGAIQFRNLSVTGGK